MGKSERVGFFCVCVCWRECVCVWVRACVCVCVCVWNENRSVGAFVMSGFEVVSWTDSGSAKNTFFPCNLLLQAPSGHSSGGMEIDLDICD